MRLRQLSFSLLTATLLTAAPMANADTIYSLLLAPAYPYSGPPTVAGTLGLSSAPPASGAVQYRNDAPSGSPFHVVSLDFSAGPSTYTLANLEAFPGDPQGFEVDFVNGNLTAITGSVSDGATSFIFNTTSNGFGTPLLTEYIDFTGTASLAYASVSAPNNPTPEPSTLALLGTGILTAVGTLKRQLRHP